MGDIETVSTTNGNMMIHLPLAALPAGRGGLAAKLNLIYNSKLWDSQVAWGIDNSRPCNPGIDPYCGGSPGQDPLGGGTPVCDEEGFCVDPSGGKGGGGGGGATGGGITWVQQNVIAGDESGGWNYGFKYSLNVSERNTSTPNPGGEINCSDGTTFNITNSSLITYRYRTTMTFPDGSVHTMIPYGQVSLTSDGYYKIRPDGFVEDCFGGSFQTGDVTYYTTDGTYARLVVNHDSDQAWWDNPWTLYLSDGTRVVSNPLTGLETIYDRNANYIQIQQVANYDNTGLMQGFLEATVITDQLGRSMTIIYGNAITPNPVAYDLIKTTSTNGLPLTYEIDWEAIGVNKHYWAANALGGAFDPYFLPLKTTLRVIQDIKIQEQPQIPPYQFSYNAPVVANWAAITNVSTGWGELSSITLPSGATTSYVFSMDNVDGTANNMSNAFDVMNNGPQTKTLKYTAENDCATAPCPQVQEVTGYSCFWWDKTRNTADYCTVVTPDGGTTKTENGVQSGLTFRTTKPDGTVTENFWAQNDGSSMASPTPVQHSIPYPPAMNPFVRWEYTSIPNSAGTLTQTIIKDTSVDLNGNTTQANEYDFDNYSDYIALQVDGFGIRHGKPSSATMKRSMVNTYYNQAASTTAATYYQTPNSPRLLNLVSTTEVRDASGNVAAHSEVSYDDPSNTGNVIQQRSWDSSKGALSPSTMVAVSHTYDSYGNPISTTDAVGTVTFLNYGTITDNLGNQYTNLYPTDVYKAYGTSVQEHASSTYDFYTGHVTSAKDIDNNVTTYTTYDLLGRPTLVVGAAGITGLERHTTTEYGDAQRRVIVRSDLNTAGDGLLVSIQHYDQLGRVRLTRKLENSTDSPYDETKGVKVQTRYFAGDGTSTNPDYHYAYQLVSNPYRAATSNAASGEPTMGWARTRTKSEEPIRLLLIHHPA